VEKLLVGGGREEGQPPSSDILKTLTFKAGDRILDPLLPTSFIWPLLSVIDGPTAKEGVTGLFRLLWKSDSIVFL
jgi:hypothetical protein